MRIVIDIPDSVYSRLKAKASLEGSTLEGTILRLLRSEFGGEERAVRTDFPLIRGKESRKLHLTNGEIDAILLG